MSKLINFDSEARFKLKKGIDMLANAVKVTLGPNGRSVILEQQYGIPRITKDGVSVAKEIELEDVFENTGAQLIKSVAAKTCDDAGDGTTTSSILVQAIITEGIKNIEAGANPIELKKGIDKAVSAVVDFIKSNSIKIEDDFNKIEQVATISANNDPEIGKLITDAFRKVSKDGVITIENSNTSETTISVVEGIQFDRGFVSSYFATNTQEGECVLESPYILFHKGNLKSIKDIIHILEEVFTKSRSLLIIADDFESEVVSTLVANKIQNNFKICIVKSPGYGENKLDLLQDLAIMTGGQICSSEEGAFNVANINSSGLGIATKVVVTKNSTIIIGGEGNTEAIQNRIAELKAKMETTPSESLQLRISKMSGGVAVLYIGANSEAEVEEKKDRVEDAICATRAALEEGVVPGGGTVYIQALRALEHLKSALLGDEKTGANIIYDALQVPLYTIAENSGINGGVVVNKVMQVSNNSNIGFNAKKNSYNDMFTEGIIDPAKVSRVALENAASIAGLILTSGCVVCIKPGTPVQTIV